MKKIVSSLDALFCPRSVAVIGAKDDPDTVGRTVMVNLTSSGFKGKVIPVNPHRATVLGLPCFKSVADIPFEVDLAVIVVPAAHVPEVMHTCGEARVKAVIIISAGFSELGESGRKLEKNVVEIAKAHSIRVLGPNCLGLMNPSIGFNATFGKGLACDGKIAFISQSGALGTAVLDWSLQEDIGFSAFVSVGSMSDVGWGDLIEYFGEDPSTKSILMYMEAVHDPRSFLSAAKEVSWRKPIIVIKPGKSKEGAHAAASHTGSLVGSNEVFDAACERAGILRVKHVSQLFDIAKVLARQPRPTGPRLSIITNAGGPAVLATDALVENGGKMAELSETTTLSLDTMLPAAWSHGNPIDILGDASPDRFKKTITTVIKDSGTDGLLVILTPQDMTNPSATARAMKFLSEQKKKPVITSWMGGKTVEEGKKILASFNIPSFANPDEAAWTFATMWKHSQQLRELFEPPRPRIEASDIEKNERREKAKKLFQGKILSERISKELLALYGFRVVTPKYAANEKEACKIARSLGFPVVLKVEDEKITHKAEANGVFLNIKDEEEVIRAFRSIQQTMREKFGRDTESGVTVQKMISTNGIELIVGSKRDEQFGQIILFGAGGVHVEVFGDRSLGLPPLTSTLAENMILRTKISKALKGSRTEELVPITAVADFLVQFSDMIVENPEIAECDINPLLVTRSGIFCLDARVVLEETPSVQNAIASYSHEYVREVHGDNGKLLKIRPVRPEDATFMKSFYEKLTLLPLYRDMFSFLPFTKLPLDTLLHLCQMDRWIVLIAECVEDRCILGLAAMKKLHTTSELFLFYELDERIGELLLTNMKEIGKKEGVENIQIQVKPTYHPLISLLSCHGFSEVSKDTEGLTLTCSL